MKDNIFKKPISKQFEFDESVATVFDDMISRSVPYYEISQSLSVDILSKILKENAVVCDLGCSTASTLLKLYDLRKDLIFYGYDNAPKMLEIAKNKSIAYGAKIVFKECDILDCEFVKSDAFILNYTLQFIRPIKRDEFIKKLYNNLNDDGVLLFSEKLVFEDKKFTKNIIEIYEDYKEKQGYSKFEISQKREALENVLIPYTQEENYQMVKNAGFKNIECIFKWANFAVFLAF
ncbi:methyltransferase [Campylobacter sputorum subsp. bubulus]|uniref:Carboxy-S-adenosyl-L-methionine synthase n=1 Tax=Campylobacter sputorum subsp. sputorum TaxID=32024 RepID=A0A381DKY2_9BACT|nr:carboxy-S-adenosyl-L-methionine synthase CmoA [Campylobacter sputorum]ASM34695.1 carboxy-S-adenosyl-L-methionine synthase [Campylobacter sputorum aubsp. sputorum RM3237]ASM36356.1 carboxy-S-adenosyl-L-methionine synthase [Campylobacter sputorum bv. faecalis CCUG 20703]KAB0581743.1 carboxy-S-adenosyl-L-methionine synthase CmoA [Campylobacter sputorum subsp. sputorum]QEL04886.1 carboxy-S-adenosyl-L-methionine synthase [Campylobacter sputorum subsp. sputorum]SUX09936.1 methyltransferase [Campy